MMRKIANRLLGRGGPIGLPPRPLHRISRDIEKDLNPNQSFEGFWNSLGEADARKARLFDYCEEQPEIKLLLKEFNVSREEFEELYTGLVIAGAGQCASGHWVAASALAYPESLRYLLSNRKEESPVETAFKMLMYFERGEAFD